MGTSVTSIRHPRARRELDIDDYELSREEPAPALPPETPIARFDPLRALLDPIDEATFVREWLGRDVLHLAGRTASRAHEPILTLASFLEGLRRHQVPGHAVRFQAGQADPRHDKDVVAFDSSNFTVGDGPHLHFGRVRDYLERGQGSMLVFDLGHWYPSVRAFEDGLAEVTGCEVRTTAFYASPGGQLYPPHWDAHDVLAVQIHGSKQWRCWEMVMEAPLPRRSHMQSTPYPGFADDLAFEDRRLDEGDVLYFPAGLPHAAWTLEQPSLHLTIAILPPRWHELFESMVARALAECEKDLDFRRPCAAALLGSQHPRITSQRERLRERLASALAAVDLDEVLAEHFARRPRPLPALRADPSPIELHTLLRRPPAISIVRERDGSAELLIGDERLSFGPELGPALHWIRARRTVRAQELPGLDDPARLALVRRLVDEGVLVPA